LKFAGIGQESFEAFGELLVDFVLEGLEGFHCGEYDKWWRCWGVGYGIPPEGTWSLQGLGLCISDLRAGRPMPLRFGNFFLFSMRE